MSPRDHSVECPRCATLRVALLRAQHALEEAHLFVLRLRETPDYTRVLTTVHEALEGES
jgi:hypothetical protein